MTAGNSTTPTFASSKAGDVFDELAALYLTSPDGNDKVQDAPVQQGPAFRELLIVGNLPVRAGLWLTPYADAIAREHGPTALVRFDLAPPTLELLRAKNSPFSPTQSDRTLKYAVQNAVPEVAVWIVRVPESNVTVEVLGLAFDRITILTGDDSAAVVAAYQMVKQVVYAAKEAAIDLPPIALGLAGAHEAAVAQVMERINGAAQSQLGIEIELAGCLPRMDSGVRCETFASFTEEAAPTVAELLGWIDEIEEMPAATSEGELIQEHTPAHDAWPPLRLTPMVDEVESEEDEPVVAAAVESFVEQADAAAVESFEQRASATRLSASHAEVKLPPKASVAAQRKQTHSDDDADHVEPLVSFVAGLSPLPMRHPEHGEVELAADESGCVHVLARESSLRVIRIVEHWARAHRNILALACRNGEIDPHGEVTAHIFTDRPATLADLHGTGLRLHVLAPVSVDGKTTWYAAPLNQ